MPNSARCARSALISWIFWATNVSRTRWIASVPCCSSFLTATKVYYDAKQTFEGAFMNRSTYESPTDKGFTVFGFGTIGRAVHVNGYDVEKFFYQKQP